MLYPVEKMCKYMKLSVNSFYTWLKNKDLEKPETSTQFLKKRIVQIYNENRQVYGATRIQKILEREGLVYSRSYIAQLMKKMELRSILKKKFKVCTTDSNHSYPVAKNQLNRDFKSEKLGQKWVSDITYIKVAGKWNYLTTIIDLADRKLIAWSLSQDMTTQNTIYKTWIEARKQREITTDHIFHSDRGVQYTSSQMTNLFNQSNKITPSMSRKGNCWDNAVAESFFKRVNDNLWGLLTLALKNRSIAFRIIVGYIAIGFTCLFYDYGFQGIRRYFLKAGNVSYLFRRKEYFTSRLFKS